jgi:[NiFe] hydrogenase diaphorase moiety small subunit
MSNIVKFIIDGKECLAEQNMYLIDAARENGVYIPSLCNYKGIKPRGSCRICSVMVNGRPATACTTLVAEGMEVDNDIPRLNEMRKIIIELLFVEGNHFCPACEKSGNCELQALAYKFRISVPRFRYQFPLRRVDANNPKLIKDHNRCILCKRCIRGITDDAGQNIFAFRRRGNKLEISIDHRLGNIITDELASRAMEICPVGALLKRGKGWEEPIGRRKYDKLPIGSDVTNSFENQK